MIVLHRRRRAAPASVAGLALVAATLAGCVPAPSEGTPPPTPASAAPTEQDAAGAGSGPVQSLPSDHVHGVGINPADGLVYLATHDGLFRYGPEGPQRVGPVIDLMGFSIAGPDLFYSSGHPGPGVDLPQPLGLAQSTDAGQTWTPLSRGGESDFHALTASTAGVLGYDGIALRFTDDGEAWTDRAVPVPPFGLATSAGGEVVLVTSSGGVHRSGDGGLSWQQPDAPLLQYIAFAGETVAVGVTPDGAVVRSDDAGLTWSQVGGLGEPATALGAVRGEDDAVRVVAVTSDRVLESFDGGATFTPLSAG